MSTWFESTIHANGISLHYYRTGGNKPPIVLLHGFTDNALCWTRVARILENEYDVIMVDARGHGLSEGPTTGFSTELRVEDTADFIHALNLDRSPFLLGHSMGAATAAAVAAQHPDCARAILLEDPAWFAGNSLPGQEEKKEISTVEAHPWYPWIQSSKSQTREERIKAGRAANPAWSDEELEPWADAHEQFNLDVLKYNTPFPSWQEIVSKITCPILLITGDTEKGAIVSPDTAQLASQLWKEGQVLHIAGAGHCIHRDQFAPYMDGITAYLRQFS